MLAPVLDSSPDTQVGSNTPHHYVLYVVDPLDPPSATQVADFGTTFTAPAYGFSYTADRATSSRIYAGAATIMYVTGGKVWAIDLRAGSSHLPRQVSAMSDACNLGQFGETLQVSVDGQDLWALVTPCASSTPVFVRSTMSPTDGPLALGNIRRLTKLDDGAMNALGFLLWDSRGLSFYSKDLVRQGDVAGSAGLLAPPTNAARDYAAA